MKIRTQFLISLVLFAVLFAFIGVSLFVTSSELDRASQQEIIANGVAQRATELGYLANDYVLNGEPQQQTRWQSSFKQLTDSLNQLDTSNPTTAALADDIKANQKSLQTVFNDVSNTITTNPMTDPATHLAFIQVSWSRLQVPTQAIVFDASRLPSAFADRASQVHLSQLILLVAIVTLMIGYFIANYFLVYRRTLRSVAELQTGARFVGSGNLDYVMPTKYDDEISDLARSFNKMTSSLKTVIASKSDLEQEVYKRAEAEEELHITNEELKIANENLRDNARKLELEIIEREKTEEALKESEAKAKALIKYAQTGIYEVDFNTRSFISVNEAMSIISGYSLDELFAMGPMGLLDEDSRNKFADRIKRQLAGEQLDSEVSYRFKKKDCTLADVVLNVAFSREHPGTALVIGHDVSERKRAEDMLQATLQRFYQMLGSMYAGVLLMTEDGKVELVNQAFCDAYGLKESPDEFKGTSSLGLLAKIKPAFKDPEGAEARIGEILQRMEPVSGEQFEMSNGRTAIRDFVPIRVGGVLVSRMWTHTDITKLKRVEKELAVSNQKNKEILDSITDDFYVLDRDWNFTYANKQFTGKIGKEPEDFIGQNIWQMFPNHIGTVLEKNFHAVMDRQEKRRFEIGGKYTNAWYRMTAFPSAEGITVIGEDITQFKNAEEALHESYAELERINRVAVGRELRMIELKKEINRYYTATGQPPRYMLDVDEAK